MRWGCWLSTSIQATTFRGVNVKGPSCTLRTEPSLMTCRYSIRLWTTQRWSQTWKRCLRIWMTSCLSFSLKFIKELFLSQSHPKTRSLRGEVIGHTKRLTLKKNLRAKRWSLKKIVTKSSAYLPFSRSMIFKLLVSDSIQVRSSRTKGKWEWPRESKDCDLQKNIFQPTTLNNLMRS